MTSCSHGDRALVRLHARDGVVVGEVDCRHLDAGEHAHARGLGLALQALHAVEVEREAALVLVQQRRHALRPPVGEELLHVRVDLGLALDQGRAVADLLLPLVRRREVAVHHRRAEGHVADGVVGVGLGVGLPDLDVGLHELAHGGLVVVVAHDAARDAGGARARLRLVEHDDVRARAEAAALELRGQVVGGREAVDAGADDEVAGGRLGAS